jgi:hypothetical protein
VADPCMGDQLGGGLSQPHGAGRHGGRVVGHASNGASKALPRFLAPPWGLPRARALAKNFPERGGGVLPAAGN